MNDYIAPSSERVVSEASAANLPRSEVTISVLKEPHKVTVYQRSDGIWIAAGEHVGRRIEVAGRTDALALGLWRDIATSRRGRDFVATGSVTATGA